MDRLYVRSMFPLIILAVLVLVFTTRESGGAVAGEKLKINWISMEEALAMAEKNPKPIVVDVYTDWCGWCKKMDKDTFSESQVVEYVNKNYYAVKLNAESTQQLDWQGKKITYEDLAREVFKVNAYPSVVYISLNQSVSTVPGYQVAKDFTAYLRHFNNDK